MSGEYRDQGAPPDQRDLSRAVGTAGRNPNERPGTQAERNLLGAVITDPGQYRRCEGLVSSVDFYDERMGRVWSGIGDMVHRGLPVDPITVENRYPDWDIRGLDLEVWHWASAEVYAFAAPEYAEAVRADSVTRNINNVMMTARLELQDGLAPQSVATEAMNRLQAVIDAAGTGELQTKTLQEILLGVDTYDWVIPGLLERMDRLVVTGPEGSGKTTWVRQLAVLSAAGIHPVTFQKIDPVQVLVVDAENTERQWRRAVRWMTNNAGKYGRRDPAPHVHIKAGNRIDVTKGSHLSEIHRLIDQHKPDILFIGPLYKLVPKAITNDDDATPLIVALDGLRERNVALVMEAHAGKATGTDGNRNLAPRGSSALLGWPEFGIGLRPDIDQPDVVDVTRWRGDRDQRDFPLAMFRGREWPWQPMPN